MYRVRQGVPLLDFIRPLLAMAEFQVNLTLLIWLNENVFWCLFLNWCFKVPLYVFCLWPIAGLTEWIRIPAFCQYPTLACRNMSRKDSLFLSNVQGKAGVFQLLPKFFNICGKTGLYEGMHHTHWMVHTQWVWTTSKSCPPSLNRWRYS